MKIFFDTNVLLSAFATRGLCEGLYKYVTMSHTLVTGEINIDEFNKNAIEKFKLPKEKVFEIVEIIRLNEVVERPKKLIERIKIRDPDDLIVITSAINSNAEILVTGDKDFLDLPPLKEIRILNPRGLWDFLKQMENEE